MPYWNAPSRSRSRDWRRPRGPHEDGSRDRRARSQSRSSCRPRDRADRSPRLPERSGRESRDEASSRRDSRDARRDCDRDHGSNREVRETRDRERDHRDREPRDDFRDSTRDRESARDRDSTRDREERDRERDRDPSGEPRKGGECQDSEVVVKVIDGQPNRNGDPTWLAEIYVPRPLPMRPGVICVRGPLRFDKRIAEEDSTRMVKAHKDKGYKGVQDLRNALRLEAR